MEALLTILGLAVRAGQIMAIIVCLRKESPSRLKICGAIGSIIFLIAYIGTMMYE